MKSYSVKRTIRPSSVDFFGNILPGQMCRLLQEAAALHAEALGVGLTLLQSRQLAWAVSRIRIKVSRLVREGEEITVTTWPIGIDRLFFYRDFVVQDSSGEVVGQAATAWLVMDLQARKLAHLEHQLLEGIPVGEPVWDKPLKKLRVKISAKPVELTRAGYSDLDSNGHVNNARYVDWTLDTLPLDYHRRYQLESLEINYLQEALPGEQLFAAVEPLDGGTGQQQHKILSGRTGELLVRAVTGWKERERLSAAQKFF